MTYRRLPPPFPYRRRRVGGLWFLGATIFVLADLALLVALIVVAAHFIAKYW